MLKYIFIGLGFMFLIEGLMYFFFTNQMKNMMKSIENLNKSKVICASYPQNPIRVVASRNHLNQATIDFIKTLGRTKLIKAGSSLKFLTIAEGKADLYPRFGSTSEWDIAAGHIILLEAGGEINSIDDKKILYNNKESVINPHFIASCKLDK